MKSSIFKHQFFEELLLKTSTEELFRNLFVEREESVWHCIGYNTFYVFFKNNIFSEIYTFEVNQSARKTANETKDIVKISNEITDLFIKIKEKYRIDVKANLKKYLYPYIMNSFIMRMSSVIIENKTYSQGLRGMFLRDFEFLESYFYNEKEDVAVNSYSRSYQLFKKLFFFEKDFKDDKNNKLVHFVYKLRFK